MQEVAKLSLEVVAAGRDAPIPDIPPEMPTTETPAKGKAAKPAPAKAAPKAALKAKEAAPADTAAGTQPLLAIVERLIGTALQSVKEASGKYYASRTGQRQSTRPAQLPKDEGALVERVSSELADLSKLAASHQQQACVKLQVQVRPVVR
jgi:hypothetical protein